MKKALALAGVILCAAGVYAAENQRDTIADGRKRNEEAYEKMLEQTGWKNEKTHRDDGAKSKRDLEGTPESSQPKSS